MLQLKNTTPFAANMAIFPDENGLDSLYINVRASFRIGDRWTLLDEQPPPQAEDVYWGEPVVSSLKYASDYHLGKSGTDVVMLGDAYAPGQSKVRELDVALTVGPVSKTLRVFGDRYWRDGRTSPPEYFSTMPLVYERAFGGTVEVEGEPVRAEERNPVGLGFAGGRKASEMDGLPLPNLEDPRELITAINDCPEPACFGFRAPNWRPRVNFAGSYDEQWQKERAPFLPTDYDRRFANGAHPDLICEGFLGGGEAVEITNMHPAGTLRFNLPVIRLSAKVEMDGGVESPGFNLETVLLEPNTLGLGLVWKAKLPCDKRSRKIRDVTLALLR